MMTTSIEPSSSNNGTKSPQTACSLLASPPISSNTWGRVLPSRRGELSQASTHSTLGCLETSADNHPDPAAQIQDGAPGRAELAPVEELDRRRQVRVVANVVPDGGGIAPCGGGRPVLTGRLLQAHIANGHRRGHDVAITRRRIARTGYRRRAMRRTQANQRSGWSATVVRTTGSDRSASLTRRAAPRAHRSNSSCSTEFWSSRCRFAIKR